MPIPYHDHVEDLIKHARRTLRALSNEALSTSDAGLRASIERDACAVRDAIDALHSLKGI